jgi:hypothetical protein
MKEKGEWRQMLNYKPFNVYISKIDKTTLKLIKQIEI